MVHLDDEEEGLVDLEVGVRLQVVVGDLLLAVLGHLKNRVLRKLRMRGCPGNAGM